MQKNKQSTWITAAEKSDKLHSLEVVFEFVRAVYHRHYKELPDYGAEHKPCLVVI